MTETIVAVLVGLVALVVSALGGWPLTAAVLRWAARSRDAGSDPAPDAPSDAEPDGEPDAEPDTEPTTARDVARPPAAADPDRAVLRGGTWIGILERLAVTGTLALGYPEGIAFVIAVKGLGRYPELREHPGLSERFVIGTLASLAWATALGAAARALVV